MSSYIFKSERLGIRNWTDEDIPAFTLMGQDKEVMKYFPSLLSKSQSIDLIRRMQTQFKKTGYGYLPVETLENQEFIGMIGMADQNYLEDIGDFVDIGWRLKKSAWGKGYATEGAAGWLKYGFEKIGLKTIYSVAPKTNLGSQNVMKKIGFEKIAEFDHPKIPIGNPERRCFLFQKDAE